MFGVRTILKKDLTFIDESDHKKLVKEKLEERKTLKLAPKEADKRELPPLPRVAIPMTESR